jgi:3-oxoacyl-[acyl-carrier protein] reductase
MADFARTLANEVAQYGLSSAEVFARWEAAIPLRRLGEPREFAALAALLVSERASCITGTSMTVDGGWGKSLL